MMAGVLTTTEVIADMRQNLGNPGTDVWSDAMLLRDINRAYVSDICAVPGYSFPELLELQTVATVAATATVDCSGGDPYLMILNVIRASDSVVLPRMTGLDYANNSGHMTTTTGVAENWMEFGDETIRIYPFPVTAENLYLEVRLVPETLADGDVTVISPQWDEVLNCYAHSRFAMRLRLYDDANNWRQLADQVASRVSGLQVGGSEMFRTVSGQNLGYQGRKD
jgi:hypothetical protein